MGGGGRHLAQKARTEVWGTGTRGYCRRWACPSCRQHSKKVFSHGGPHGEPRKIRPGRLLTRRRPLASGGGGSGGGGGREVAEGGGSEGGRGGGGFDWDPPPPRVSNPKKGGKMFSCKAHQHTTGRTGSMYCNARGNTPLEGRKHSTWSRICWGCRGFPLNVSVKQKHTMGNHLLNGGIVHCPFNRETAFHGLSFSTDRPQGHGIPLQTHTEAPCTAMQRLWAAKMVSSREETGGGG